MKTYLINTIIIILTLGVASCGSLRTFHEYAQAGDTVAVPVGMQKDFSKSNITVTITPSSGLPTVLSATDPAIRGIINLYPDPVSSMAVSREIQTDLTPFAETYADSLLFTTNEDEDYFQTVVFIDLPTTLPLGLTDIEINNGLGDTHAASLDIIGNAGTPNTFNSDFNGGLLLTPNILDSLARIDHYTVTFDSATIPSAIEVTFTHDPDVTVGGIGKATVINPTGYRKSVNWSDDGTNMKIIMTESKNGNIDNMNDYKFYIAGTATNLAVGTVNGYDSNGNLITGVTTTLVASN